VGRKNRIRVFTMTNKETGSAKRFAQELLGVVKKEIDPRKSNLDKKWDERFKVLEDKSEELYRIIAVLTVMQVVSIGLLLSQMF